MSRLMLFTSAVGPAIKCVPVSMAALKFPENGFKDFFKILEKS